MFVEILHMYEHQIYYNETTMKLPTNKQYNVVVYNKIVNIVKLVNSLNKYKKKCDVANYYNDSFNKKNLFKRLY